MKKVILLVISLFLFIPVACSENKDVEETRLERDMQEMADQIANNLNTILEGAQADFDEVLSNYQTPLDHPRFHLAMVVHVDDHPEIKRMYFGKNYLIFDYPQTTGSEWDPYSDRPFYITTIRNDCLTFSQAYPDEMPSEDSYPPYYTFTFTLPVYIDDTFMGVLGMDKYLDITSYFKTDLHLDFDVNITLLNEEGEILYRDSLSDHQEEKLVRLNDLYHYREADTQLGWKVIVETKKENDFD